MNGEHWSQDDVINYVYGVGPDDGHLNECSDCRSRVDVLQARRRSLAQPPEVSQEFLAEQRREIHRRLEERHRGIFHLTPAFGAVLLLLLGLFFLYRSPRHPRGVPAPAATSDAQLFSDIYAMEQTSEPHVTKPMRALFEEN